jgi:hypothetical protein
LRWLACDFVNYESAKSESAVLEVALFILLQSGAGSINLGHRPPLPASTLAALSEEVAKLLEAFVEGKEWKLDVDQRIVCTLQRVTSELPADKGKLEVRSPWRRAGGVSDKDAFRLIFLLSARDLLMREGANLGRCQYHKCQAFFIQQDPRQKYCSDAHGQSDRQYRYRTGRTVGEVKQ